MATADDIINGAVERANAIVGEAQSVASSLVDMANWNSWVSWNYGTAPVSAPATLNTAPLPAIPGLNSQLPNMPQLPSGLGEITLPALPPVPSINLGAAPVLDLGQAPTLTLPDPASFIGTITTDFAAPPEAPDLEAPEMGTLSQIQIPDPPALNLPTLDLQRPVEDFLALEPKTLQDYYDFNTPTGSLWASDNLDIVQAKLRNDLLTGGTGIEPEVQAAIYNKAAERDLLAANDALRLAAEQYGKLGFPSVAGRLQAQQGEILSKYAVTRAETSRVVMATTAELAQKNIQFAVTGLTQIEQLQIQFAIAFADRMLSVAKGSVDAAISWFNASIARFNARLDAYKTEAATFESLLRAEAQKLDIYKGQLEGAKLQGDLNLQEVETYKARMAALQIGAELYKAKIDGYNVLISAERSKIDVYKARAEVFQALVQGESARLNAYEAQIRGEIAKVQAYQGQVDAEKARLQIYTAQADVALKTADTQVAIARIYNEQYSGQIAAFKAQTDAIISNNSNVIQSYKAQLDAYTANTHVQIANSQAFSDYYRSQIELYKTNGTLALEGARLSATHMTQNAQVRATALGGAMSAYASMASGAMSAVNGIAQVVTQA